MSELDRLREGGVVGGGGAGFPLWKKLSTNAEVLLINGAECEPLLRSDQFLMLYEADTLVCAANRLRELVGAERVMICLKEHYHAQRKALEAAIAKKALPVCLHELPTVYPIGDEQAVVRSATGRTVPPGGLPGAVGCTVVSVSTAINAWHALEGTPVTHRLVTVAGEVKRPGLYRVPVGTRVNDVLAAAGGLKEPCRLMLGGPMMGVPQPEGSDPVVTKLCGGILALPVEHPLLHKALLPPQHVRNRARSVCIQCRTCTDLCPRYLAGHPIYPHLSMRAFAMGETLEKSAALCMDCGVCELYACPMGINPRAVQRAMKAQLRARGERDAFELSQANPFAEGRQVPSERLAVRIGVSQYAFEVPAMAVEVEPEGVRIPMCQHIGAPAAPCVAVGDELHLGQPIGRMATGALGADVHASINGRVAEVTPEAVRIERRAGV
ncbi:MAG: SLBB domain-containing protein [Clostridia bacterium]